MHRISLAKRSPFSTSLAAHTFQIRQKSRKNDFDRNAGGDFWLLASNSPTSGFQRGNGNIFASLPGRCVHDAIERIYLAIKAGSHRCWMFNADIKGCFDNIDHDQLLEAIGNFPVWGMIRRWLMAGYMEDGAFDSTEQGTPQGGVISPSLRPSPCMDWNARLASNTVAVPAPPMSNAIALFRSGTLTTLSSSAEREIRPLQI